jgi:uncharacterized membrane protein
MNGGYTTAEWTEGSQLMLMQDRMLQALMLIGSLVLVLLWNAGVWNAVAIWILILFALLVAYTALKATESSVP